MWSSIVAKFKSWFGGKKDPVVTKPVETKPVLTPVETKPVEMPPMGGSPTEIPSSGTIDVPKSPEIETPVYVKKTKNEGNPSKPDWTYLWDNMKIDPEAWKLKEINDVVAQIVKNYARYKYVQDMTGVPWKVVGVIHHKEASLNFLGALHNGDKIIGNGKKTWNVPSGRGPFSKWEDSAIDALNMKKSQFPAKWTPENILIFLQKYNGLGHQNKGLEYTPYLWAYTNMHDETGNYVTDGKYSSSAVIKSAGCSPILVKLEEWEANQIKLGLI